MKRHALVIAGIIAAQLAAPASAQTVRAGIQAWQKSDYESAVSIWRPLAEGGDPDAQFNLGQAYRLGRGVKINLAAAKTWFERAAAQDHVDAQTTLGLLLFQNGEQATGITWLGKAAEKGEARAMLIYGTALVNGDTVPRDLVLGYAYVSRAAAQGLEPAKQTLAQLDELLPLGDRKKGLEIAKAKAKAAPPPGSKVAIRKEAKAKPAAKPAEKPMDGAKTDLPAPKAAQAPPTAPAKDVSVAAATAPASGAWRVQLGAFSQKSSAESLWAKVAAKLGGRQPYYVPAGNVVRLQVGPFESKAAASAACAKLGGQACFVVPGK